jgi:hypothetical protein
MDTTTTAYTYSIFDSAPARGSASAWPSHDNAEIEADSDDDAIASVLDTMECEAAGLSASDGYEVGQVLYGLVMRDDQIVGTPMYVITAEDIGVTKYDVESWESVASYVATYPGRDDDDEGACDVDVQVGDAAGVWFVRTTDDAGGGDDSADHTIYASRDAAEAAAAELAWERDEAEPSEDAEDYLRRRLIDRAGEPDPDGDYCVYWDTALDDSGPRERYASAEAATAAAEIAQRRLEDHHPGGRLKCGYSVRVLMDGEWQQIDSEVA